MIIKDITLLVEFFNAQMIVLCMYVLINAVGPQKNVDTMKQNRILVRIYMMIANKFAQKHLGETSDVMMKKLI